VSGAPILQNGKLVGAVTYVLIDDSTTGYGIFAENMLETAQGITEKQIKEAS
jgi:stage IV sporulation protein B